MKLLFRNPSAHRPALLGGDDGCVKRPDATAVSPAVSCNALYYARGACEASPAPRK